MSKARSFEEARDFAGAEWNHLTPASRARLLRGHRVPVPDPGVCSEPWKRIPESTKRALTESLMGAAQV